MQKSFIFTLLLCILGAFPAQGNDFQFNPEFHPATGDREFNNLLIDINLTASRTIDNYILDLSSSFNVPRKKVLFLIYNERMQPADAFMLLQIARLSGHPYKKLLRQFNTHRRKGWGAVVISLGIKPGSRMFLLLQEDIPSALWNYSVKWKKGSKRKKGSRWKKKGSKRKRGSKGKKGSKR